MLIVLEKESGCAPTFRYFMASGRSLAEFSSCKPWKASSGYESSGKRHHRCNACIFSPRKLFVPEVKSDSDCAVSEPKQKTAPGFVSFRGRITQARPSFSRRRSRHAATAMSGHFVRGGSRPCVASPQKTSARASFTHGGCCAEGVGMRNTSRLILDTSVSTVGADSFHGHCCIRTVSPKMPERRILAFYR